MLAALRPSPALARRLALVLPLAAIPRLWAAWNDNGFFWPDEIYQTLEPAHRLAFGYGFLPWEYRDGARSWLLPGLLGGYWKLLAGFGITRTQTLIPLTKLLVVILGLVGIAVAMRWVEKRLGAGAALLAGLIAAAFPPMLVYGSRVMAEMISGPLVVVAVALLDEPNQKRSAIAAGAILGALVFLRYQNGIFIVGLLVLLLARGRRQDALHFAIAATVLGLAGGALDWATWGKPFWSLYKYLEYNIVENKAAGYGTASFGFYVTTLWTTAGIPFAIVAAGFVYAIRKERGLVLITLAYVVIHSIVPHKELRFITPAVPLFLMLAAEGLAQAVIDAKVDLRTTPVLGAALAAVFAYQTPGETFASMGQYTDNGKGKVSVWHADEGATVSLWAAADRPDVCGVTIAAMAPAWMGGYTYFHRDLPFALRFNPNVANYAVAPKGIRLPGYSDVGDFPPYALYRREGGCSPPPGGQDYALP